MSDGAPKKRRRHKTAGKPALSARELRFCAHYAESGNATEAYRAAGFPERTAQSTWTLAWRLLRSVEVRAEIRRLRQEALDAAGISVNRVAQGLARVAFADIRELYDERGCLKPPHEWPDDVAAAVEGHDSEEDFRTVTETDPHTGEKTVRREAVGRTCKVRLAKRLEALRVLATWKKMIGADGALLEMLAEIERLRTMVNALKGEGHADA